VNWLRRIARPPPAAPEAPASPAPEAVEGAAPGVTALLSGVRADRSHAVLDLGPAADSNLRVYGRFARWIRFADLLGESGWPRSGRSAGGLVGRIPAQPENPYDLVFAWDALDRLFPEDRPRLVERLAELSTPDARLHLVVRADDAPDHSLRFTLLDVNRIRYAPMASAPLPRPRLLPAELMKLLLPFQVVHAFTLRSGLREYVAVRSES
jgi:hypothetical protein